MAEYSVMHTMTNTCQRSCSGRVSKSTLRKRWFADPCRDPETCKKIRIRGQRWQELEAKYGSPPALNNQRRVIYVGYWLSNDNIASLVNKWKEANITHVLLTFITQLNVLAPLSDAYSMTLAYANLTPQNKQLLKDNFILGVSYGGGAAMPSPYSTTFQSGAYYANNPELLAQDLVNLSQGLTAYYDLDIEHINDQFDACANFLGRVCMKLKDINPGCQISHAPQPPYLTPQYGNVYNKIYADYHNYFNFFNVQYYNNGPSNSYEQIFITAASGETAVLQLINAGIDASYIVVGKPVNANEGSAGGYIPLVPTLGDIIERAFSDPQLAAWAAGAGVMIWYYNTQDSVSVGNDNILSYMTRVSYFD